MPFLEGRQWFDGVTGSGVLIGPAVARGAEEHQVLDRVAPFDGRGGNRLWSVVCQSDDMRHLGRGKIPSCARVQLATTQVTHAVGKSPRLPLHRVGDPGVLPDTYPCTSSRSKFDGILAGVEDIGFRGEGRNRVSVKLSVAESGHAEKGEVRGNEVRPRGLGRDVKPGGHMGRNRVENPGMIPNHMPSKGPV